MGSDDELEAPQGRQPSSGGVSDAAQTRCRTLGPDARPVAVPEDMISGPKATGVVTLPLHVCWSGPDRFYDLAVRSDRVRVYEMVLREGTEDDVRTFVDVDLLLDVWGDLLLPAPVREAWAHWYQDHRQLDLRC